ncbi:2-octaprenyl-3-methyl-6-methoxy-1,4-benzoquinol hydroxylase [Candidatus Profftia lariciata]|uniref:FAD-dependent monooxygenase n=1 Tax=Candidatus Profftia lariciata TaxID=1987921 RepID=UPI001D03123A|nr:FAD-dependent monooxygenase [Candidatus Profftia lariciata]UDG81489.1 2-octaprenyl-3-methyl-6-methoxy-1,4-benzoquinol hydroxylase [Candidatus Profftia lariciata]
MTTQKSDVVVIGSGMIGSAAALGLGQAGFSVRIVENYRPQDFDPLRPPQLRISAINIASVNLMQNLGIWQDILRMRGIPYRSLEIWEWDKFHLIFKAKDLGIPELGYMLENNILQLAFWSHLEQIPNIMFHVPSRLDMLRQSSDGWIVSLNDGSHIKTKLVLGADGKDSQVRTLAGIGLHGWQYRQSCMLISVVMQNDPLDITWQQFTPHGPRAFLPLWEQWGLLVWYDDPGRIRQLMTLSMKELTKEITSTFPKRLGNVQAITVKSFSLERSNANCYVQEGLVLLGDAAHTIHPLAGQGVNLGYRDVSCLLAVIIQAREKGKIWSSKNILKNYQNFRIPDNLLMQAGIDLLYFTFHNKSKFLQCIRNMGLIATEHSIQLKKYILKYLLGL